MIMGWRATGVTWRRRLILTRIQYKLVQRQISSIKRLTLFCVRCVGACGPVMADIDGKQLRNSIVVVTSYRGKNVQRQASGFVVRADRFNGYVVTGNSVVQDSDTLTIAVPQTGAELVAQVLHQDEPLGLVVLKVNGLNLPAVVFTSTEVLPGSTLWAGARVNDSVSLIKGALESRHRLPGQDPDQGLSGGQGQEIDILTHTMVVSAPALMLNNCTEVVGIDPGDHFTVDADSVRRMLQKLNINQTLAPGPCVSLLALAREKADLAAEDARRAQSEAEEARQAAESFESKLAASSQRNEALVKQTRQAWERAEVALQEAAAARQNAVAIRGEFETQANAIKAETEAIVETFSRDQRMAVERFEQALAEQQAAAEKREIILLSALALLFLSVLVIVVVFRVRESRRVLTSTKDPHVPLTEMHHRDLSEYVLDGRDDDGIRYLLRISGDQLVREDGVVIGRNPKDSPYIINHSDVSRKHARMKLMRDRIFIEDLGSTNGTSVNGQAIEDKGPVTINNGDQVIIGSVVMKLRVLD